MGVRLKSLVAVHTPTELYEILEKEMFCGKLNCYTIASLRMLFVLGDFTTTAGTDRVV